MSCLISVIIPVYNVERYLRECIESVIRQSYINLEIILIDDGSTDNCWKICKEYEAKDKRIKIINKKNGGLSEARNVGLKIFEGDFLVFVDSDDYMEVDGIERMYNLAKKTKADLVIGGTKKFLDNTKEIIWTTDEDEERISILKKEEAIKDVFLNGCAAWGRLYKREIHEKILFPVGEINEDEAIVIKILEQCKRIVKTNKVVYNYRCRNESITTTEFHRKKIIWYKHCKENLEIVRKHYPELEKYARTRYITSILWCLNNMTINTKKFKSEIKVLRKELRGELKRIDKKTLLNNKERLRAYILVYCYDIYTLVVKYLKKSYS